MNEVICHGIPDDRPLADGDICNLDVTIYLDGVHGDTNATFLVGDVDDESRRLVDVTRECLERAIAVVRPGQPFNEIGRAIQEHAEANGFGVVRSFVGHGIGEQFHTDLHVPHYYEPRLDRLIEEGMTFTIEPMITMGAWEHDLWDDGWTAVTVDRRRTAQFEHTLVVTPAGCDVLCTRLAPSTTPVGGGHADVGARSPSWTRPRMTTSARSRNSAISVQASTSGSRSLSSSQVGSA